MQEPLRNARRATYADNRRRNPKLERIMLAYLPDAELVRVADRFAVFEVDLNNLLTLNLRSSFIPQGIHNLSGRPLDNVSG